MVYNIQEIIFIKLKLIQTMNAIRKSLLSIVFTLFVLTVVGQQERYVKVKIDLSTKTLKELMQLGIADEGAYKKGCCYTTEIPFSSVAKLESNGFLYQILQQDVSKYYIERNKRKEVKTGNYCPSLIPNYTQPAHFRHGSMGGYLNYNEVLAELDSMRHYYPNLISQKSQIDTFHTIEGRAMYYVRISDNANVDEDEPEALYLALTHAREPMGMQQLVWFMWYMLENYGTNPEITYLLDNSELYFVPVVNPDGYVYNQTTNPDGGGMWRKNRRANGVNFGIDLNRNYGFQWGYDNMGSSIDPSAETYRGTAGFSEPETQIIKWFCENHHFKISIDYHTYSNILLYPWGYIDQETNDQALFEAYAKLLTSDNHFAYGTPGQLLYTTNGGSFDWFYGEQSTKGKMISLSPEAGSSEDGFWPAESRIDELCNTFATMNLMIARLANKYVSLANQSPIVQPALSSRVSYSAQVLGLDTSGTFTVSLVDLDGVCASIGNSISYSNVHLLQQFTDSIPYTLHSTMSIGNTYRIGLKVENSGFVRLDTLNFVYGMGILVLNDSCNTITDWSNIGGTWVTTTSTFVSPPSSISDGNGNYSNNANTSIIANAVVNLQESGYAQLSFNAKWNLEKGYDFVQIQISDDNGANWAPLCGIYTVDGSSDQLLGEPLYDGEQNNWVVEQINLSDYLGKQVKFRFVLVSDGGVTEDGFYFDDFNVIKYPITTQLVAQNEDFSPVVVYPNPNIGQVFIKNQNREKIDKIELYDIMGNKVFETKWVSNSSSVDFANVSRGCYFLKATTVSAKSSFTKIIIK